MGKNFIEELKKNIMNSGASESEKSKMLKNILQVEKQKINLMVTGATGCGKSSTINALFDAPVAKVGNGPDPETMDIQKYELDNLIIWDTPGLGDGKVADERHAKNIIRKLNEKDEDGNLLIDLVLVILDGSTRDLGTSYDLINNVIIPNLGSDKEHRILIAINQCDVAMKGKYWNEKLNKPEAPLVKFLDEKVASVKKRIKDSTGVNTDPIYYSAGYNDPYIGQMKPYNLSKLLYYIVSYTPKKKRVVYVNNINQDKNMWKENDNQKNYNAGIFETIKDTVSDIVFEVTDKAKDVIGGICDFFGGIFSRW